MGKVTFKQGRGVRNLCGGCVIKQYSKNGTKVFQERASLGKCENRVLKKCHLKPFEWQLQFLNAIKSAKFFALTN